MVKKPDALDDIPRNSAWVAAEAEFTRMPLLPVRRLRLTPMKDAWPVKSLNATAAADLESPAA